MGGMKIIKDKPTKSAANWSALKARLSNLDPATLVALLHDLYAASKDNQAFLHARLTLGDDVLKPYKATITQWINPADPRKPQSVAKAKKAITDYKKALGQPDGLAELAVFYCEEVFAFLSVCGVDDEDFYVALVSMFEQALKYVLALPAAQQPAPAYSGLRFADDSPATAARADPVWGGADATPASAAQAPLAFARPYCRLEAEEA